MTPPPHATATRFPTFRQLETLSFVNSGVFAALLLFWLGPSDPSATMVLGWMHGLMWIALSLLSLVAVRHRTIPFWLAVLVAVIGGIGPFAGTVGFVVQDRRRSASPP